MMGNSISAGRVLSENELRRLARRGSSMLTAARDPARVTRRASISRTSCRQVIYVLQWVDRTCVIRAGAAFSDDVFALVMGSASTPSEELVRHINA
jgi:hypothetical protein